MKSFKTELFKISFNTGSISLEHIKTGKVQTLLSLPQLVAHVIELDRDFKLSKDEAVKIITKSSEWML
jgi:hypothetical protein